MFPAKSVALSWPAAAPVPSLSDHHQPASTQGRMGQATKVSMCACSWGNVVQAHGVCPWLAVRAAVHAMPCTRKQPSAREPLPTPTCQELLRTRGALGVVVAPAMPCPGHLQCRVPHGAQGEMQGGLPTRPCSTSACHLWPHTCQCIQSLRRVAHWLVVCCALCAWPASGHAGPASQSVSSLLGPPSPAPGPCAPAS